MSTGNLENELQLEKKTERIIKSESKEGPRAVAPPQNKTRIAITKLTDVAWLQSDANHFIKEWGAENSFTFPENKTWKPGELVWATNDNAIEWYLNDSPNVEITQIDNSNLLLYKILDSSTTGSYGGTGVDIYEAGMIRELENKSIISLILNNSKANTSYIFTDDDVVADATVGGLNKLKDEHTKQLNNIFDALKGVVEGEK